MKGPSIFAHLRDIILLPFMVTVVVPWFIDGWHSDRVLWMMIVGAMSGLTGITLLFYTIRLFGLFGEGTLAPWHPTQRLVIVGPYRYVRNPMISGVVFILVGESLFFHSVPIAGWAAFVFVLNTWYFISYEEPSLEERFGEDYRQYKKRVGRWIPTFPGTPVSNIHDTEKPA